MRGLPVAWLVGLLIFGAAGARAELVAEELTRQNVRQRQLGGPDAIGGLGDFYLANDVVEAVVDHPKRRHAMVNHGGTLVDVGLRGQPGDDQFARLFPLVNLTQRVFVDYDAIRAEIDPGGAWARVVVTSDGMRTLPRGDGLARALDVLVPDEGALAEVHVETVYEVRPGEPFLRLHTRFENRGATPAPIFAFGDLWMRGGRSMRAFLGNALAPELARGFHHRNFSAADILGSMEALAPFSHVAMAGLPAYPPIAYALFSPERTARGLSFFGVSGEHVNLAMALRSDPGWRELTTLRLLRALRSELPPGESWEVERRLLVTPRSDDASATDVVLPALGVGDGTSGVSGETRPETLRTVVHVHAADGHPVTQILAERGRYRAALAPGRYRLHFHAPHRVPQHRELEVRRGETVRVEPVVWPRVATLRFDPAFDDGGAGRVVFRGLGDTPDPVFGAEHLDFRVDGEPMPSATESNALSFVGTDADPLQVSLPYGRYRLVATRGLEWDVATREVEVGPGTERLEVAPFALRRVARLPEHLSADFHVHAEASEDSGTTNVSRLRDFVAVGVQVLVATDHDKVPDYDEAIRRLGLMGEIRILRGVEVTSSTPSGAAPYTIGHHNAWPVPFQPLAHRFGAPPSQELDLGSLYQLLRREYRAEVVQMNHPRGKREGLREGNYFTHQGTAGFAADARLPLEASQNAALLLEGEGGTRPIDFDVIELMNGDSHSQYLAVRDDFHWLLRQGHRRAATANSDSHGPDELPGLPRNYVRVGAGGGVRDLQRALREGRSFGTNGPLVMRFQASGGESGDTVVALGGTVDVAYEVSAAPWVPIDEVRLLVNGEVVRRTADLAGRARLSVARDAFVTLEAGAPLDADPVRWRDRNAGVYVDAVAPGFLPAAFANPIYVDADGDGRWTPPGLAPRADSRVARATFSVAIAAGLFAVYTIRRRRRR